MHLLEFQLDIATHPFYQPLQGDSPSKLRIEVEVSDQVQNPGPAHDFLADRLQPDFSLAGDRRLDEGFRDLLMLHEHSGSRSIEIRQGQGETDRRNKGAGKEQDRQPFSTIPHLDQPVPTFASLLVVHGARPSRPPVYGTTMMSPGWRRKFSRAPAPLDDTTLL